MARTGRPPLATDDDAPSVKMTVRVPAAQFDATYATARELRVPLAEYVRDALRAATDADTRRRKPGASRE